MAGFQTFGRGRISAFANTLGEQVLTVSVFRDGDEFLARTECVWTFDAEPKRWKPAGLEPSALAAAAAATLTSRQVSTMEADQRRHAMTVLRAQCTSVVGDIDCVSRKASTWCVWNRPFSTSFQR